jgi:hypothetical protein
LQDCLQSELLSLGGSMTTRTSLTDPSPNGAHEEPVSAERRFFAATRHGKKPVTVFLSTEEHRRLKRLAIDADATLQELMSEAVRDLLAKRAGEGA